MSELEKAEFRELIHQVMDEREAIFAARRGFRFDHSMLKLSQRATEIIKMYDIMNADLRQIGEANDGAKA